MKQILALGALFALFVTSFCATPAQAAPGQRCFNETGFCIAGSIRDYWENNGGLAVFGYPIGPVQQETVEGAWTGPVQWFERDRLEDHANEGKGILAGRLGARYLELTGRPWQRGNGANLYPYNSECRTFFKETGYQMCGSFRAYWEQHGGLARFGYPITEPFDEQVGGKTFQVQYFERRRLEIHPENAGTPYEVLLGLLGRDVHQATATVCSPLADKVLNDIAAYYQASMGCATARRDTRIVHQYFDGGEMIWVPGSGKIPAKIYAILPNMDTGVITWAQFVDDYREGEAVGGNETAPRGRYTPQRGFGKVWWNTPVLRQRLGWAQSGESESQATVLVYGQQDRLMMKRDTGTIDIFLPTGEYSQTAFAP